ncbi:MAG: hypothetical protein N3A59_07160, partial [Thermodesulfovibrionales bacterium]|nr:hypothetical protein [Thermodesulfovibrionales bacterium]
FQYGRVPEDVKVTFFVDYIKIMDHWAWVEAQGKNYNVDIYALLVHKDRKWIIQGMVDPRIIQCLDPQECIDIKNYIYRKFKERFPAVPPQIFPEEYPESKAILNALRNSIKTVSPESINFIVRNLKIKNNWAWIESDPLNFEPIDALLHKKDGKWQVKNFRPCCGECEEDSYCAKGIYHKKLIQMFPSAPKEILPNKTRRD